MNGLLTWIMAPVTAALGLAAHLDPVGGPIGGSYEIQWSQPAPGVASAGFGDRAMLACGSMCPKCGQGARTGLVTSQGAPGRS